jgi:general stress protein 26
MTATHDDVWTMIAENDICMLTTRGRDGLRARPMSSIPSRNENLVYILAARSGRVDDDLRHDPNALLVYTNASNNHLSLAVEGRVLDDLSVKERLWNAGAQAFWPAGPTDPEVIVLALSPQHADLWKGPNAVVAAIKMTAALVAGTSPDLGEKASVTMASG